MKADALDIRTIGMIMITSFRFREVSAQIFFNLYLKKWTVPAHATAKSPASHAHSEDRM